MKGHINKWCKYNGIVKRDRKLKNFNIQNSLTIQFFLRTTINLL